jgi:hypothetical protein
MKKRIYANYKRGNKWLGIIDYKSLSFIIIYAVVIFFILKNINLKLKYSFYFFVIFMSPVISLITINLKNESAIDAMITVLKFIFNRKIFVNTKYIKKDMDIYK